MLYFHLADLLLDYYWLQKMANLIDTTAPEWTNWKLQGVHKYILTHIDTANGFKIKIQSQKGRLKQVTKPCTAAVIICILTL